MRVTVCKRKPLEAREDYSAPALDTNRCHHIKPQTRITFHYTWSILTHFDITCHTNMF